MHAKVALAFVPGSIDIIDTTAALVFENGNKGDRVRRSREPVEMFDAIEHESPLYAPLVRSSNHHHGDPNITSQRLEVSPPLLLLLSCRLFFTARIFIQICSPILQRIP